MIRTNPDFRSLASARFFFALAMQAQATVIGWTVYDLTKDPLYLGLIGLTEFAPAIGLSLYAGWLVDRGKPFNFYRGAVLFALINSAILALVNVRGFPLSPLPFIFAAIFGVGVTRSFVAPSVFSLVPHIVKKQEYMQSTAWLTGTYQVASISGPAIGGLLYAAIGRVPTLLLVTLAVAVAWLSIGRMSAGTRAVTGSQATPKPGADRAPSAIESIREGLSFIFRQKVLLSAISLDMFSVLFGGATAILPAFADQVLASGPQGLGILRAAPAVGAVLMSAALIRRPLGVASGKLLLWVVAAFGVCMVGFGLSRTYGAALAFLFISGAVDSVSMITRGTMMQLLTPDSMRGRVSAVNSVFISSSNELGEFESGVAARFLGLVPSIVFGGCMTLLVAGMVAVLSPQLRRARLKTSET